MGREEYKEKFEIIANIEKQINNLLRENFNFETESSYKLFDDLTVEVRKPNVYTFEDVERFSLSDVVNEYSKNKITITPIYKEIIKT